MKKMIVSVATIALLVGVACNHESTPAKGVETTGAGVVANDEAVQRLTDARCERAKACNELGGDNKYADESACKREVGHDLQADFRPGECPRGIKQEKMSNCLQEIKNEKCGNLIDKLSRSTTCRSGSLCVD